MTLPEQVKMAGCGSLDLCFERYNETHFTSDGKVFVLGKYFNAEPIGTIPGEWQLFPGALKMDLKNNGSLVNSRSQEPGENFTRLLPQVDKILKGSSERWGLSKLFQRAVT